MRQSLHYAKQFFAFLEGRTMSREGITIPDAKTRALEDLRLAARALMPHLSSPGHHAELQLIDEAIVRLSRPEPSTTGLRDFDAARLSHLLDLAGPDIAEELLARLTEDLTSTSEKLDLGTARADWALLREGSHVLISLAGSVGALSLQEMAEALNALSHRQDHEALTALMPPLAGELSALIALIRRTTPTGTIR
jgi:HPt (histidine-containing phosphotransfer) domain-containing protein